jgi:phosphate transport system substrate-binding protein
MKILAALDPHCLRRAPSVATLVCLLSLGGSLPALAVAPPIVDSSLPAYQPRPVQPPNDARYVLPDGSIRIIGAEHAQTMIDGFNALFGKTHPGTKFATQLRGTTTAMPALTHGVTPFAPIGRAADHVELVPYKKIVGAEPLEIRIAHASHVSRKASQTIAIYVNKANPLDRLTMEQVTRIFATGHGKGDLTDWGQLGLQGDWAKRAIHPYGTPEYTGFGDYMERNHFKGLPFSPNQQQYGNSAVIVKHVGSDASGIGFASISFLAPDVKIVALARNEDGYYSAGSVEDAVAGKYPLERFLYFYVRHVPGQPPDPFVNEYMRLIMSREGQQIIAAEPDTYVPLTAPEAAAELEKLK